MTLVTRYVTLTGESGQPLSDVPIVMYDATEYNRIYTIVHTDLNGVAYFTDVPVPQGSHYAFRPRIRRSAGLMGASHKGYADDTDNAKGVALIGAVHLNVVAIEEDEGEEIPTAVVEYIDSGSEAATECTDITLLLDNSMWQIPTFMPLNAVGFVFIRNYSVAWNWTGHSPYWMRMPYVAPEVTFTGAIVTELDSIQFSQRTLLGGPAGDIDTINAWAKIWEVRPDPHAPHINFGLPGATKREGVLVHITHSKGTLQVKGFYTPCVEDESTLTMKMAVTAPLTGPEHRIRTDVSQDRFTQNAGIFFMFFSSYPNGESDTGTAYFNGAEIHETNNHITYPSVTGPNNGQAAIDWPDYSLLAFSAQFGSTSPHLHDPHVITVTPATFQDALDIEPELDTDDMLCVFYAITEEDWSGTISSSSAVTLLSSEHWTRDGGDQYVKAFSFIRPANTTIELTLDLEQRFRLSWAIVAVPDYLSICQSVGAVQDVRGDLTVTFPDDFSDPDDLTVVSFIHNEDDVDHVDPDADTPQIGPVLAEGEVSDWERLETVPAHEGDPILPLTIKPGGLLNLNNVPVITVYWQIGQNEFDVRDLLGVVIASEVSQEEPGP